MRNCSCSKCSACDSKCNRKTCQICDNPAGPPLPPSRGGWAPTGLPSAAACVGLVASDGIVTQFCADAGEAATVYSTVTASSAAWATTLTKSDGAAWGLTAALAGTVSVLDSTAGSGKASELKWWVSAHSNTGISMRMHCSHLA